MVAMHREEVYANYSGKDLPQIVNVSTVHRNAIQHADLVQVEVERKTSCIRVQSFDFAQSYNWSSCFKTRSTEPPKQILQQHQPFRHYPNQLWKLHENPFNNYVYLQNGQFEYFDDQKSMMKQQLYLRLTQKAMQQEQQYQRPAMSDLYNHYPNQHSSNLVHNSPHVHRTSPYTRHETTRENRYKRDIEKENNAQITKIRHYNLSDKNQEMRVIKQTSRLSHPPIITNKINRQNFDCEYERLKNLASMTDKPYMLPNSLSTSLPGSELAHREYIERTHLACTPPNKNLKKTDFDSPDSGIGIDDDVIWDAEEREVDVTSIGEDDDIDLFVQTNKTYRQNLAYDRSFYQPDEQSEQNINESRRDNNEPGRDTNEPGHDNDDELSVCSLIIDVEPEEVDQSNRPKKRIRKFWNISSDEA